MYSYVKFSPDISNLFILKAITDISGGCGTSFSTVIVSDKFIGQPLLQRHRMVNSALSEELQSIHAFTMKTLTPEQWEKQQAMH